MIAIAFGTRPEWLKIKSVVVEMKKQNVPYVVIFTGQHSTLIDIPEIAEVAGSENFIYHFGNPSGDGNRLNEILANALTVSNNSIGEGTKAILVQGDTTSAMGMAIAAFHKQVPVIHLEAGLRTYDLEQPFPEEANRQIISKIASLHLCPTDLARANLLRELINDEQIAVVGNTVLDNIRDVKVNPKKKVLVTMHRRENHARIDEWFANIDALAATYHQYEFLLPAHPNPNVKEEANKLKHIKVVEPLSHDDLVDYLSECSYVITDSGGIQEEASFLKVPCMVCREQTERIEALGVHSVLCKGPEFVSDTFGFVKKLPMLGACPYGDGKSAQKVVEEIVKRF